VPLRELLTAAGLPGGERCDARGGPTISDLVMSSDRVAPGALFACVRGQRSDGHDHVGEALSRGAVAVLCERALDLPPAVPQVVVPSVRRALGPLAAALWAWPSRCMTVVGVTGTNGKTTTCSLLASVLAAGGKRADAVGTLTGARTTPEAPDLQRQLAALLDGGVEAVAMEVSSHALAQHRVEGTEFAAGVFTNLSQDHLDYHKTMEAYFEAKASLFTEGRVAVAVVNRHDPFGARLVERLQRLKPPAPRGGRQKLVTYSPDDATDLRTDVAPGGAGTSFRWRGERLLVAMPGRFNVSNAVAAATVARELGVPMEAVSAGLAAAPPVRGRFELVDEGQPFHVVVDFAHTPVALKEALSAARELSRGRVLVVFGAGGDRDPGKRPAMGRVASQLADVVVVTSDNPRTEDPLAIIDQVLSGASGTPTVEPDRRRAIEAALRSAGAGDVVVIAGKGHEEGQDFGSHVEPFDDRAVARELLRRAGYAVGAERASRALAGGR
jgi:UDP-N-acetylmuramoyl-L-alanyl-D-glutamate--2,6-diaminopimelate ligase